MTASVPEPPEPTAYRVCRDSHLHLTGACSWTDSFQAELPAIGDEPEWAKFFDAMRRHRIVAERCPSCDRPWVRFVPEQWT